MTGTWDRLHRRVTTTRKKIAEKPADGHGLRHGESIRELRKLQQLIDELIDEEIVAGRAEGAPWSLLGTSKQQAQQQHARALTRRPDLRTVVNSS